MTATTPARATRCCRSCGAGSLSGILSLGTLPLANAFPASTEAGEECRYPVDLAFCEACSLVQLEHVVPPAQLFSQYLYFSSYSASMLRHAEALAAMLVRERDLHRESLVIEIASNDGYLLQFLRDAGTRVLGIEPARNVAREAREKRRIPTLDEFFDDRLAARLAADGQQADIVLGLNVMAHVPDLNGFMAGIGMLLKPGASAVIEVPYVRDMVERTEFDTIYHEHLYYFSVHAAAALVERHGLVLERVDRIPIHGGSLRLFVARGPNHGPTAHRLFREETALGLDGKNYYQGFRDAVEEVRTELTATLTRLRDHGASIAAYGAAAKGTVLLNYCGIGPDTVAFVADRNPHKQGRRMPGCGIPIVSPEAIAARRPDFLLLLVWNLKDEILKQETAYRFAGGRFIVPVPKLELV